MRMSKHMFSIIVGVRDVQQSRQKNLLEQKQRITYIGTIVRTYVRTYQIAGSPPILISIHFSFSTVLSWLGRNSLTLTQPPISPPFSLFSQMMKNCVMREHGYRVYVLLFYFIYLYYFFREHLELPLFIFAFH